MAQTNRYWLFIPLALALSGMPSYPFSAIVRIAHAQSANEAETTIEKWMNEWIGRTKAPVGTLHLSRFKGPVYFLLKPISWKPNPGQESYKEVIVPKGFVTDFASIPRIFWSILRPDGDYTYPAIIHDYLYWTQTTSRKDADSIFRMAMEDFGISTGTADTIYAAVRVGGETAWRKNAKDRLAGEKRILIRYPQDPRTRWEDWKQRPGVFLP